MAIEFDADAVLSPMHPGEIVREEFLEPLGLSAGAAARAYGGPETLEREVGAEIARIAPLERAA